MRIAPAERDLWLVVGDSADVLEVLHPGHRPSRRRRRPGAVRLWWKLTDIASFVDDLRRHR
ncbi:hypothetical protein [Plantactinospora sp. CA-290183]|uniref:hypothetical protein n=1 Tax=Plantactinospora sp. CA-290183 TaxID=3240006 RepID=UPI003D8E328C